MSDDVEVREIHGSHISNSGNDGTMMLHVRNVGVNDVVVRLTYLMRPKTIVTFPKGTLVVPTSQSLLVQSSSSSSSSSTSEEITTLVDISSDSDVQIIEQEKEEEEEESSAQRKKKRVKKKVAPPTKPLLNMMTRLIPVRRLSQRIVAMGLRLSKYTDARPLHIVEIRIDEDATKDAMNETNKIYQHQMTKQTSTGGGGGGGGSTFDQGRGGGAFNNIVSPSLQEPWLFDHVTVF